VTYIKLNFASVHCYMGNKIGMWSIKPKFHYADFCQNFLTVSHGYKS